MQRSLVFFFDKAVEYLFYLLFFLVPIVLSPATFELFEFNKMWLTFGITTLIGFFWFGKMILTRDFRIQRTPLDIPILLFLLSQIISTILSLDSHVSLWGYYSRFNGGLLSYIAYIFLYYAFVSNFSPQVVDKDKANLPAGLGLKTRSEGRQGLRNFFDQIIVRRMLLVSIASGVFVSLWGLPSHFGYDPTCKLFKGTMDVACWTSDFQPKIRIFSTMGQPAWLAAYLAILLPVAIAFALSFFQKSRVLMGLIFTTISILFFVDLLFTRTRAGTIGIIISFAIFFGFLFYEEFRKKTSFKILVTSKISAFLAVFVLLGFFIGTTIGFIDKFSFSSIKNQYSTKSSTHPVQTSPPFRGELGGTDSSKIRLIVWKGALEVFKNNPIFGTGVETFAYAYYKYRPPEHNLTSEWNFLYNKAHNEFLNFMATTGTFGILSYLSIIFVFSLIVAQAYFSSVRRKTLTLLSKVKVSRSEIWLRQTPYFEENKLLGIALFASFASILVTNFFGFSVVITNIYLFMIPCFVFMLWGMLDKKYSFGIIKKNEEREGSTLSRLGLGVIFVPVILIIIFLINSWRADTWYALGYNLDRAGQYQDAYPLLHKAVSTRSEPVFRDEMAVNDAVLAVNLMTSTSDKDKDLPAGRQGQNQKIAQNLAQEAIAITNQLTTDHPSNIVFLKTKVRIYYTLSQLNASYLPLALEAIRETSKLAPTEASIHYNLGVLTGQNGDSNKAVKILEETIKLKPDYRDAHFALGLFYRDLAIDKNGNVVNTSLQEKAEAQMKFILEKLAPNDTLAKEQLNAWTK